MPSRNIEDTSPILREQYLKAKPAFEKANPGVSVILTATYRSNEEQNELYAQGRTKPGNKVTNAKAGQSAHNHKMAIDVAFVIDGKLNWQDKWFKLFSVYMKNPLIEWGGGWITIKDLPHYEVKGWKKLI